MWTVLLLWAATAAATDRGSWGDLHSALLYESADGDLATSQNVYRGLVRSLPTNDPIRAKALYWLARSHWLVGEVSEAREALLEGIRTGACRERCLDLLERIELDAAAIRSTPVQWDFETPQHGLFHPWRYDHKGTMRLGTPDGYSSSALIWSTTIDVRTEDQLVMSFSRPDPAPAELAFTISAFPVEAWIRVFARDEAGRTYTWGGAGMAVPTDDTMSITITLDRMVATDGTGDRLDPSKLVALRLVDTTGFEGDGVGENQIFLDDFSVR